jgi:starch synthase
VHNGIDTTEYQPDHNTDTLERLGVDKDRLYACFVGGTAKGWDLA